MILWPINLDQKPKILRIGEDTQGHKPVEFWCLEKSWVLHLYRYEALLNLDGHDFPIRPGCLSLTPPGAMARYHFQGKSTHLYVIFDLPGKGSATWRIPAMQDLGRNRKAWETRFQDCIRYFREDALRAEVRLWDILMQASEGEGLQPQDSEPVHPAFHKAIRIIQDRLAETFRVSELAEEVNLSHNQLTRLFLKHRGNTVVNYILARRLGTAIDLLNHTDMPVKAVAGAVGIPDLHHFNKLMKKQTGYPPREFRLLSRSKVKKYQ